MNTMKKITSVCTAVIIAFSGLTAYSSDAHENNRLLPSNPNVLTSEAVSQTTLIFPINNGMKIGCIYGYSKAYFNSKRFHTGIDINATGSDKNIYSAISGTVDVIDNSCKHISSWNRSSKDYNKCNHINTFGNRVIIKGDDGRYYIYGHMEYNSAKALKKGQRVNAGDVIGRVGSSGASTGVHLHFEVRTKRDIPSTRLNVNMNGGLFKYINGSYTSDNTPAKRVTTDTIENGKVYTISPVNNTNLGITVAGSGNKANAYLKTLSKTDTSMQWRAIKNKNHFYFQNVKTKKYLDCAINSVKQATNMKNVWCYSKATDSNTAQTQMFATKLIKSGKNSFYNIKLYNSNFSLDVYGDSTPKSGANLQIYSTQGSTGNTSQQWVLKKIS